MIDRYIYTMSARSSKGASSPPEEEIYQYPPRKEKRTGVKIGIYINATTELSISPSFLLSISGARLEYTL